MSKYDRIKVLARIRPLNAREVASHDEVVVQINSGRTIEVESSTSSTSSRCFELDAVLDPDTSQNQVFDHILPLLESSLEGYNCTIFTYGQTGTGKTFTMLGYDLWGLALQEKLNSHAGVIDNIAKDEEHYGIVPKTMKWLLDNLNTRNSKFSVAVSYVELYNDIKIIDLLAPGNSTTTTDQKSSLEIRENKKGEIIVPGLTQVHVHNSEQVLEVLWKGAQCRSVAATDMNDYSSRSHTVFMVYLAVESFNGEVRVSKICLVDLAGSEKWKSHQLAKFNETRIAELKSINRSLSALGNCISALLKPGRAHIPYRDSKLTRLLQDSLGGNTQTLFVVTLSPSLSCVEETISTLQFADRAMKVQVVAKANKVMSSPSSSDQSSAVVAAMNMEIVRLKALLQLLLRKCGAKVDLSTLADEIRCLDGETKHETAAPSSPPNTCRTGTANIDADMDDFDACISQELVHLKEENFGMLREFSNAQEELCALRGEKQKILSAIFNNGHFLVTHRDDDDVEDGSERGGYRLGSNSYHAVDDDDPASLLRLKQQVLDVQQEEQDVRRAALMQAEETQEERWQFLQQYHQWLHSQAAPMNSLTQERLQGIDGDVYRRVCLMEASVLLQADELQRTKNLFLSTNNRLHAQLADASSYIDDLLLKSRMEGARTLELEQEIEQLKALLPNEKDDTSCQLVRGSGVKDTPVLACGSSGVLNASAGPTTKPPEPALPPPPSILQKSLLKKKKKFNKNNLSRTSTLDVQQEEFTSDRFLESLRTRYLHDRSTADGVKTGDVSKNLYMSFSEQAAGTDWCEGKENENEERREEEELCSKSEGIVGGDRGDNTSGGDDSSLPSSGSKTSVFKCKKVSRMHVVTSPQSAFLPIRNDVSRRPSQASSHTSGESSCVNPPQVSDDNDDEEQNNKDADGDGDGADVTDADISAALELANLMIEKHKKIKQDPAMKSSPYLDDDIDHEGKPVRNLFARKKLWKELYDDQQENVYYYNRVSGETTWECPTDHEMKLFCEDGRIIDSNGNDVEMMDEEIDIGIEIDDDIDAIADALSYCIDQSNNHDSDTIISDVTCNDFEVSTAVATVVHPAAESISAAPPGRMKKLWRKFFDENRAAFYYHCKLTGTTTWKCPSDFEMSLYCLDGCVVDVDGNYVDYGDDNEQADLENSSSEDNKGEMNDMTDAVEDESRTEVCDEIVHDEFEVEHKDHEATDQSPGEGSNEIAQEDSATSCGVTDNYDMSEAKEISNQLIEKHQHPYQPSDGEDDEKHLQLNGDELTGKQNNVVLKDKGKSGKGKKGKSKSKSKSKGKRRPLWSEVQDAGSGDWYYFNRLTRATTWTRPPQSELDHYFCEDGILCDVDGNLIDTGTNLEGDSSHNESDLIIDNVGHVLVGDNDEVVANQDMSSEDGHKQNKTTCDDIMDDSDTKHDQSTSENRVVSWDERQEEERACTGGDEEVFLPASLDHQQLTLGDNVTLEEDDGDSDQENIKGHMVCPETDSVALSKHLSPEQFTDCGSHEAVASCQDNTVLTAVADSSRVDSTTPDVEVHMNLIGGGDKHLHEGAHVGIIPNAIGHDVVPGGSINSQKDEQLDLVSGMSDFTQVATIEDEHVDDVTDLSNGEVARIFDVNDAIKDHQVSVDVFSEVDHTEGGYKSELGGGDSGDNDSANDDGCGDLFERGDDKSQPCQHEMKTSMMHSSIVPGDVSTPEIPEDESTNFNADLDNPSTDVVVDDDDDEDCVDFDTDKEAMIAMANRILDKHKTSLGSISTREEYAEKNQNGFDMQGECDSEQILMTSFEQVGEDKDKSKNKSKGKSGKGKKGKSKSKSKRRPLWSEVQDAGSGDWYYFNRLTRATTWTRPPQSELDHYFCEDGILCDVDGNPTVLDDLVAC